MKVLGIGGSTRARSSTELLVRAVLDAVAKRGAETEILASADLMLPPYEPGCELDDKARRLVAAVREADALILGSPGYHGSLSGFVKNAIDYFEELRDEEPPYLDGRPVGVVVTAYGWQAAVNTLAALRQVVHALRGWPTPLGIAINAAETPFGRDGRLADDELAARVDQLAGQLVDFVDGELGTAARKVGMTQTSRKV